MKNTLPTFLFCILTVSLFSQNSSGEALLEKSIAYHDPAGQWSHLKGTLNLIQTFPGKPDLKRVVHLDNRSGKFSYTFTKEGGQIDCSLEDTTCTYRWNGSKNIPDSIRTKYKLTPERAKMYRNYYTYLYGLPMKLKDPGTILHKEVEEVDFFGRKSYRLKATYAPEVGTDTWYFYFDKNNFALVAYQFYHDESKNDGEYILLEDEKIIEGVRMPMVRSWYTNEEGKLLGTDILQ